MHDDDIRQAALDANKNGCCADCGASLDDVDSVMVENQWGDKVRVCPSCADMY